MLSPLPVDDLMLLHMRGALDVPGSLLSVVVQPVDGQRQNLRVDAEAVQLFAIILLLYALETIHVVKVTCDTDSNAHYRRLSRRLLDEIHFHTRVTLQ